MSSLSRIFGLRNASPVASGLYWSGIWLAVGAIILSILLAGSSLKESGMLPWVFGVHGFATLAGGFVSAKKIGAQRLVLRNGQRPALFRAAAGYQLSGDRRRMVDGRSDFAARYLSLRSRRRDARRKRRLRGKNPLIGESATHMI